MRPWTAHEELADGSVLIIQKIGRRYNVTRITWGWFDAPQTLAEDVKLDEARRVFADELQHHLTDSE